MYYLVEVKAKNQMDDPDVLAKKNVQLSIVKWRQNITMLMVIRGLNTYLSRTMKLTQTQALTI